MPISFGGQDELTARQQANAVLQTQLEGIPTERGGKGRRVVARMREDPQGQFAIPTSFAEIKAEGIPVDFKDLASRRYSLVGEGGGPTAGLTFSGTTDPGAPLTSRTRVSGTGTLLGMGANQFAQGVLGLAELAGIDARAPVESLAKAYEEDYQNLDPDVAKAIDAEWLSMGPDSVLQNPSALFYQTMLNLPMTALTLGVPVTRAVMVARAVTAKAVAAGVEAGAAKKLGGNAAAKAAALWGAGTEGTLDVGFTKEAVVDMARTSPLDELMQAPKFKEEYDAAIASKVVPAQAEVLARDRFGKFLLDTAGTSEALTAGALTALFAAAGEGIIGKLIGGGIPVGRAKRTVVGLGAEATTEAAQEPTQAQLTYEAQRAVSPATPAPNLAEQAAAGFGLGAILGGGIGAASPGRRAISAPAAGSAAGGVAPPAALPTQRGTAGTPPTGLPGAPPAAGISPPTLPPPAAPPPPIVPPIAAQAATGATTAPGPDVPTGLTEATPPVAAAPVTPVVPVPVEPPVPSSVAELTGLLSRAPDRPALTGLASALGGLKVAVEETYGITLPAISNKMGVVKLAGFIDELKKQGEPEIVSALTKALTAPSFATAAAQIEALATAVKAPAVTLAEVGTPTETAGSQFARARATADKLAALPTLAGGKPKKTSMPDWINAVGDFAVGLEGLIAEKGLTEKSLPAGIRREIKNAKVRQEGIVARGATSTTAKTVRASYNKLTSMAAAIEAMPAVKVAPAKKAKPAPPPAAEPKPAAEAAVAAEPAPKEVTPADIHAAATAQGIAWDANEDFMAWTEGLTGKKHLDDMTPGELNTVLKSLPTYKPLAEEAKPAEPAAPAEQPKAAAPVTKGAAIKEKVKTKQQIDREALAKHYARNISAIFKKHPTRVGRHKELIEMPMHELQATVTALGIKAGKTKPDKVKALIEHFEQPTQRAAEPAAVVAAEPAVPKAEKAEKAKTLSRKKTVEKAETLPELEVPSHTLPGQKLATATQLAGFTTTEEVRVLSTHPIFENFNKADSPWALVAGLRSALTDAQNATLAKLAKRYREAKPDDVSSAWLALQAFMANVDGKRVPKNVNDAYMKVLNASRDITQQANTEREMAGEATETIDAPLTQEEEIEQEVGYGAAEYEGNIDDDADSLRTPAFAGEETGDRHLVSYLQPAIPFIKRMQARIARYANEANVTLGTATQVLRDLRRSLPDDNLLSPLVDRLIELGLQTPIRVRRGGRSKLPMHSMAWDWSDESKTELMLDPVRDEIQFYGGLKDEGVGEVINLLHEIVHAATVHAYYTDGNFQRYIEQLREAAHKAYLEQGGQERVDIVTYGFTNGLEFMAEALTSPWFQDVLSQIKIPRLKGGRGFTNVLDAFVTGVRKFLGLSSEYTALDLVIRSTTAAFRTEQQRMALTGTTVILPVSQRAQLIAKGMLAPSPFTASAAPRIRFSNPKAQAQLNNVVNSSVRSKSKIMDWLSKSNVAFMDNDVMERKYRTTFERAAAIFGVRNPHDLFVTASQRAEAYARDLGLKAGPMVERMMKLPEQTRQKLYQLMLDSTLGGVHADLPVTRQDQPHLFDKAGNVRPQYDQASKNMPRAYHLLQQENPEAAKLYSEIKGMLQEAYERKLTETMLHIGRVYGLKDTTITDLTRLRDEMEITKFLNTHATNDPNVLELGALLKGVLKSTKIQGPYFPLRREGDWVVHVDDANGEYFAVWDTEHDAQVDRDRLRSKGRDALLTRKLDQPVLPNAAQEVIRGVLSKVSDPDTKKRIQEAMISLLADGILYSSTMERKGIAGVNPQIMGKAFEDYIRSSMSYVGNISSAFDIDEAMKNMARMQTNEDSMLTDEGMTDQQVADIGLVHNELTKRNKELAADRNQGDVTKFLGRFGFLIYLGAPSYWVLGSTQTAIISVPYLAGRMKVGYVRASMAMKNAYKLLYRVTKGMGYKGMMDLDAIVAKLEPKQQAIIKQLIKDNVIGSTIAYEFGEMISKKNIPIYTKTVKMLQTVPELIERFNRLSTALAAIELGADYQQAKDAVQATQFNYSPQNRARLLKYLPVGEGGGGRPIVQSIMMFKLFGINMARIIYGNMYDALKGKTPEQRAEARKILGGILLSHSLFGGLYGGLGLGAAQIVGGAINALLDPEDEVDWAYEVDRFIAQHTNEYIARIITRGAPASVGADLSASINTGNLLFMMKDTSLTEPGGVETAFASMLGPIAQYGMNVVKTAAKAAEGETNVAQFVQGTVPIKFMSSLARTYDQGFNGLKTSHDQQYMKAGELSIVDTIIGAAGLRSARVAQRQQQFFTERGMTRSLETHKSTLMQSFNAARGPDRVRAAREIGRWNASQRERGNRELIILPKNLAASKKAVEKTAGEYAKREYTPYR